MARLAAVLLLVSGCSVALQSKPRHAACSTSHAYWIADAVGAAAGVAAVAFAVATSSPAYGAGGVGGVIYLASASNGIRWRRQCESGAAAEPIASR